MSLEPTYYLNCEGLPFLTVAFPVIVYSVSIQRIPNMAKSLAQFESWRMTFFALTFLTASHFLKEEGSEFHTQRQFSLPPNSSIIQLRSNIKYEINGISNAQDSSCFLQGSSMLEFIVKGFVKLLCEEQSDFKNLFSSKGSTAYQKVV